MVIDKYEAIGDIVDAVRTYDFVIRGVKEGLSENAPNSSIFPEESILHGKIRLAEKMASHYAEACHTRF